MCYCLLNYNGSLLFVVFYIKLSRNFIFPTKSESVISLYFLTQFFEAVKEFHNLQFRSTTTFTNTLLPLPQHR